jgi:mRNA interferase HicA
VTNHLASVINFDYDGFTETNKGALVKQSEFVRWLKQFGATFEDGTNHTKVKLNGRTSFIPRHPGKELKRGLVEAVKKQLDLK